MSEKIYLIGNSENYQHYLENINNLNYLPLDNLPVVYFPFDYNNETNNTTINIFSTIVDKNSNIIEKIDASQYKCDADDNNIKCSNVKELYNSISNMEEKWQPYNNNNIKIITYVIGIIWLLLIFIVLKLVSYYFNEKYSYIIISLISAILFIGLVYAFFITNGKI
jgi:hypothetical protein